MSVGVFSYAMLRDLERLVANTQPSPLATNTVFGMPVRESKAFPFTAPCAVCGGTGEGEVSTYCPTCKGGGRIRYEGVMTGFAGGRINLFCSYFPKAFEPRFPFALPVRPLPSRDTRRMAETGTGSGRSPSGAKKLQTTPKDSA